MAGGEKVRKQEIRILTLGSVHASFSEVSPGFSPSSGCVSKSTEV